MGYKKLLASALPLGLLCCRIAAVWRVLEAYRDFWTSGSFDWLHMPFLYAVSVFLIWAGFTLFVRWGPFLVPLCSAAAPWLPQPASKWVYVGCIAACVPVFLGEGLLYLINTIALDSTGHVGEMPLAELLLAGIDVLGLYLTRPPQKR